MISPDAIADLVANVPNPRLDLAVPACGAARVLVDDLNRLGVSVPVDGHGRLTAGAEADGAQGVPVDDCAVRSEDRHGCV